MPHDRISGKYVTLRWGKIYFDGLEFSDGAKNLGCLATGQERARKKMRQKIFSHLERKQILKISIFEKNVFLSNFSKIQNFKNRKFEF